MKVILKNAIKAFVVICISITSYVLPHTEILPHKEFIQFTRDIDDCRE